MRVFFITGEWKALERFVRGQVPEPEGMPSVYQPWLRYCQRGYDVNVFMIGQFQQNAIVDFQGCRIHLVGRPRFFAWRNRKKYFRLRFPADCYFVYKAAVAVAKDNPPDIVYSLQPWYSYAAWAMAKKYRSVCVKRIYGTALYELWFTKTNSQALVGEEGPTCVRSRGRLMNKLSCFPHFAAWLCPSDMMVISNDGTRGDKIADILRIKRTKYRFWFNGISKDWMSVNVDSNKERQELGITPGTFVLMCLSRLSEWKRQDRVIDAMPRILQDVPNAKLLLVGDGPERSNLEQRAKKLGVLPHVQFVGAVLHSRVKQVLSVADVFLQVNDWSCVGNSLLEALTCGKTVVTWDVGGTAEVIKDGQNGILLPDAEPARIAGAVVALAKDPERRQSLARGAREFAKKHLQSWDERLDMEIDLGESMIRSKK